VSTKLLAPDVIRYCVDAADLDAIHFVVHLDMRSHDSSPQWLFLFTLVPPYRAVLKVIHHFQFDAKKQQNCAE
jgi:hypothetical protein